ARSFRGASKVTLLIFSANVVFGAVGPPPRAVELERWALCLILVVAALLKLRDSSGVRDFVRSLGRGDGLATTTAFIVLAAELAVAALLVRSDTVRAGAVASAVLFVLFSVVLAVALSTGARASCRCFGSLSGDRVSRWSLLRNAVLLGLAALVAIES